MEYDIKRCDTKLHIPERELQAIDGLTKQAISVMDYNDRLQEALAAARYTADKAEAENNELKKLLAEIRCYYGEISVAWSDLFESRVNELIGDTNIAANWAKKQAERDKQAFENAIGRLKGETL